LISEHLPLNFKAIYSLISDHLSFNFKAIYNLISKPFPAKTIK